MKKMADTAIKSGQVIITSAIDFFTWASTGGIALTSFFVTADDVKSAEKLLRHPTAVTGLNRVHTLCPYQQVLWMRETSCTQACCSPEPACEGWVNTDIAVKEPMPSTATSENMEELPAVDKEQQGAAAESLKIGDIVEATYDGRKYVGQVKEYSEAHCKQPLCQGKGRPTYIALCTRVYIELWMCVCMYICMYVYVCVYVYVWVCMYMWVCVCMYTLCSSMYVWRAYIMCAHGLPPLAPRPLAPRLDKAEGVRNLCR